MLFFLEANLVLSIRGRESLGFEVLFYLKQLIFLFISFQNTFLPAKIYIINISLIVCSTNRRNSWRLILSLV